MYNVKINIISTWAYKFVAVVHSLSCVWLFETPWTIAHQAPLSSTVSQSLLKLMSIESVMLSNHLILCRPISFCLQYFLASGSFPGSRLFTSEYWSFSFNISPSNEIQGWFPLGLTGLISMESKGLSRVFSSTTVQKHQFWGAQPFYGPTLTSIHD